jgi:hypothetical protein
MATRNYISNGRPVNRVVTITVAGTWVAAETITLTIASVEFVITIGSLVTTTQVATTIKEAVNGTTLTDTTATCLPTIAQGGAQVIPMFSELTATSSGAVVTITSSKEFTLASTETSTSGTVTDASVSSADGLYHFGNQDNWSGNTVPVDTDTIVFDAGSRGPLYGLLPAIQPAAVEIPNSFLGKIGLAEINIDNPAKTYSETRTKYLTFDDNSATTTYTIGHGVGTGSGRLRLSAGAGQAVWNVRGSGTRELTSTPCVLLIGTHASNELNNFDGDVGVAFYGGETSTLATLRNGSGARSVAKTWCGSGVTLSSCTVTMNGGTLTTNSAISAANVYEGTWTHRAGNVATVNVDGGTVNWEAGSATITTLRIGSATFDKSRDPRPLTVTNAVLLYAGATLNDPNGTITFSGGITLVRCTLDDVTLNLGPNRTYTIS